MHIQISYYQKLKKKLQHTEPTKIIITIITWLKYHDIIVVLKAYSHTVIQAQTVLYILTLRFLYIDFASLSMHGAKYHNYTILLDTVILLYILKFKFLNIHLCFSINVRDQVSRPYSNTDRTTVLYISKFRFI